MISNNKVNAILKALMGSTNLTAPSRIYLGVCSSEPTASDGKVTGEPTATSYGRKEVTDCFGTASGGVISNSVEIQMPTAREAWGAMNYFFLSETQSTSGYAYMWGKIYDKDGNEGLTIQAETVPVFYEGELKASIDVALS